MKLFVFLALLLCLVSSHAQSYNGFGVSYGGSISWFAITYQQGNVQPDNLELRYAADLSIFGRFSFDALYSVPFEPARFYLGAGPELLFSIGAAPNTLGVHAVVGFEYRVAETGIYLETQPFIDIGYDPGIRFRAGVNLY